MGFKDLPEWLRGMLYGSAFLLIEIVLAIFPGYPNYFGEPFIFWIISIIFFLGVGALLGHLFRKLSKKYRADDIYQANKLGNMNITEN